MAAYTTKLKYAGRPIIRDSYNNLFYVVSKHRTYKAYKTKDAKRDHPTNVVKIGSWYLAIYRMNKEKEREARIKLGIIR